jgi:hypothetical protein
LFKLAGGCYQGVHVQSRASHRLYPAVPADQSRDAAFRRAVAARNQARWLPGIARKDGTKVRLYSRPGNDLTDRFPLIAETVAGLPSRSCVIDGEAVACGDDVDLIELDGADLRREPLEVRKATLVSVRQRPSAAFG